MAPRIPIHPDSRRSIANALQSAAMALQMHRPDEAERIAAGVLKSDRGNAGAATLLTQALMAQNRLPEAVPPLQQAVRRGEDPRLETLLASALVAAGNTNDARAQLHRTMARRPPFPPAFAEYAGLLVKSGEIAQAFAVLEEALTLAPDEIALMQHLASLHLSVNARGKARAILQQAFEHVPGRADIAAALARIVLLDGDYAAAADLFRRALGLRPADAMTRADLAICLLEMGERAAGEAALRKAVRDQPALVGRATHALAAASHGRFFLRPSAVAAFLNRN